MQIRWLFGSTKTIDEKFVRGIAYSQWKESKNLRGNYTQLPIKSCNENKTLVQKVNFY